MTEQELYERMIKAKERLREFEEQYDEILMQRWDLQRAYKDANTAYIEKNLLVESKKNDR